MPTDARVPLSQRVNYRMVIFAAAFLVPIGLILWIFFDTLISHGVWDVTDSRGAYKMADLKALSMFEMDQMNAADADVPAEYRALDGRRVMLVGEMYTGAAAAGRQADFQLVYSIQKCCFTGVPKVQHFVKSKVMPGKKVQYYPGLVKALGILHVGVEKDAGQVLSLYRLDVESVEPVK